MHTCKHMQLIRIDTGIGLGSGIDVDILDMYMDVDIDVDTDTFSYWQAHIEIVIVFKQTKEKVHRPEPGESVEWRPAIIRLPAS